MAKDYLHLHGDKLATFSFEMMFFFSTQTVFVARERRFFFSSAPFWLLLLFIGIVTVLIFVLCCFNVGFLHISRLKLWHQFFLFGLSLCTRFIIYDPITYILFRIFLPREQ